MRYPGALKLIEWSPLDGNKRAFQWVNFFQFDIWVLVLIPIHYVGSDA